MSNHYHFVAQAPVKAETLKSFIQALHSITAKFINKNDGVTGRRVWYNYWDSCITYETSYLARLRYVHNNPVKHEVVTDAKNYRFCSSRWFIEQASPELRHRVLSQPFDKVRVIDDF